MTKQTRRQAFSHLSKRAALLILGGISLIGCGSSGNAFVSPSVANSRTTVARPDVYTTAFEAPLIVSAERGVLLNDTLAGTPIAVNFQSTTLQGGRVTADDNQGGFTYTPPTGFLGTDTFGYEVSTGATVSRTTVTIEVSTNRSGFLVDSNTGDDASANADGRPFATVQAAVTQAGPNTDILVLPGNGTYTGRVQLLNGQRLLGIDSALARAQGQVRPTLTGPIVLADGNTLDSLRVARTNGIGIDGDDQTGGVITNCEISDTSGNGIQIRDIAGNWTIEDNFIRSVQGIGLDMDTQQNQTATVRANRNVISGCRMFGLGLAAFGQSAITVQANDNSLSDNGIGLGPNQTAAGFFCPTSDMGTVNLQMVGNSNDALYLFVQAGGPINVQRFDQFEDLNQGQVTVLQGQVTPVDTIPGL